MREFVLGSGKVLYIVKDKESIQFRYRCENVIHAMKFEDKWEVNYCLTSEADEICLDNISIIVVVRQTAKNRKILTLIRKAREKGVVVLFDVDDLIFDYRDLTTVVKTVGEKNIIYWLAYFWGVRRIMKKVDGFLCTNEFLGEKLKRSFKKPYGIIPNSLNEKQIEISEGLIRKKKSKKDGFVIGYFSGSPTHEKDFRLVEPALVKLLEEYDDIIVRVIGYMNFSKETQRWIRLGRIETSGKVDYLELQKLISEVDVSIAPLVINDFTNCKSELKFFEAAIVETTTIASPTYAFKKAIRNGKNGFLAEPGEWYNKLEYLYKHYTENEEIAKQAREYVLNHYCGREFVQKIEEAYDFFDELY